MLVPAATMLLGKWAFWPTTPGAPKRDDRSSTEGVSGPATVDIDSATAERERELVLR
jgi:uncharacterized membrane protein YdfJ with MMPL/SSD domain